MKFRTIRPLAPLVFAALLWEFVSRAGIANRIYFPPISLVLGQLYYSFLSGDIVTAVFNSLERMFVAYSAAALIAVPLGLILGWKRSIYTIFEPLVEFMRPIPSIAIIAPTILFLGIGSPANIFVVLYACLFIIFINSLYGVYGVDKLMVLSMNSMGANDRQIFRMLVLPSAVPYVFSGLRTALPVALIVEVASEMILGSLGIGYYLLNAERTFQYEFMYAGILVLGLLGYVLNKTMLAIESRVLRWSREITLAT